MDKWLSDVLIDEYTRILAIAYTMVDNDADARDLVQDLAEKIVRNDMPASSYEKPLAYFSKIMRNKRRDDLKGRARKMTSPLEAVDTVSAVENVETAVQYHQAQEIFQSELRTLPPEMQEAFMMVYFDGFTLEEAAQFVGIAKNTLSQRFRRFRLKLGKRMNFESITMSVMIMAFLSIG